MAKIVLDNPCNGIGDAVMWCWTAHTLAKAGHEVKVCPRKNHETFEMFGTGPEWWTDKQTGKPHPPKGTKGGRGWLDEWVHGHCGRVLPHVRPPYVERKEDGEWAEKLWADRDRETGKSVRVLVCPEVVYKAREWPKASFALLAHDLMQTCNVVTVQQWYDSNHSFPWAVGGLPVRRLAALLARAHVVVGNDSGPAHFAATIGTPVVVVCGPSDARLFFGHYKDVTAVTSTEVRCGGCNFEYGRGFRSYCDSGCAALATISPAKVGATVRKITAAPAGFRVSAFGPVYVRPQFGDQDEEIVRDVFQEDCYLERDLPYPAWRCVDVGANLGAFVARLRAGRFPDMEIVAIEVDPRNVLALRVNWGADPRVHIVQAACTYEEGDVRFWSGSGGRPGAHPGGGTVYPASVEVTSPEYDPGVVVEKITLEGVMAARGWTGIDLLKLDCEGSEYSILEHGPMDRVGCIVGEWHDNFARFHALVRRKFPESLWSLDILRQGDIGLFRLGNRAWHNLGGTRR